MKWGLGPRVAPETKAFLEAWCARERVTAAALVARLLEDEHARLLLGEFSESSSEVPER